MTIYNNYYNDYIRAFMEEMEEIVYVLEELSCVEKKFIVHFYMKKENISFCAFLYGEDESTYVTIPEYAKIIEWIGLLK